MLVVYSLCLCACSHANKLLTYLLTYFVANADVEGVLHCSLRLCSKVLQVSGWCRQTLSLSAMDAASVYSASTWRWYDVGLMTQSELTMFEGYPIRGNKYWVPAVWAASLVHRARRDGRIKFDIASVSYTHLTLPTNREV